jgi:hypothetical protein
MRLSRKWLHQLVTSRLDHAMDDLCRPVVELAEQVGLDRR